MSAHGITGSQAPIFRSPAPVMPIVQPRGVFVSKRKSFDVTVRQSLTSHHTLSLLFDTLPLLERGWALSKTRLTLIGTSPDKWPIWRVERS